MPNGLDLSVVGMGIIVLSWVVQIVYTCIRDKKMTVYFAVLQAIGIAFLVAWDYKTNSKITTIGMLNVLSAAGGFAMAVLILAKKRG